MRSATTIRTSAWHWNLFAKRNSALRLYGRVLSKTPWKKAIVYLSLKGYIESDWFEPRRKTLGLNHAIDQYLDGDYRFFHKKARGNNRWKIIFTPYTCIEEGKATIRSVEGLASKVIEIGS